HIDGNDSQSSDQRIDQLSGASQLFFIQIRRNYSIQTLQVLNLGRLVQSSPIGQSFEYGSVWSRESAFVVPLVTSQNFNGKTVHVVRDLMVFVTHQHDIR